MKFNFNKKWFLSRTLIYFGILIILHLFGVKISFAHVVIIVAGLITADLLFRKKKDKTQPIEELVEEAKAKIEADEQNSEEVNDIDVTDPELVGHRRSGYSASEGMGDTHENVVKAEKEQAPDKRSRTQKVLDYLKEHGEITSEVCKEKFQYSRLSDIILELKKRGENITTEKLPEFDKDGKRNHPKKVKYIYNKT